MYALKPLSLLLSISALSLECVSAARKYSSWMADSAIARGQGQGLDANGNILLTYEHGVLQRSLELLYNSTGNATYLNYIKTGADRIVNDDGSLNGYDADLYSLDDIRLGEAFLFLYRTTGSEKYKKAADTFLHQLYTQPRTHAGAFWHRGPFYYQQWLDGVYMADTFYAHYVSFYQHNNITAWNDIVKQYSLIEVNLLHLGTGLLKHGYDESKTAVWADQITGACPHVWIRAVGWYLMALVDVLDYFPVAHPGYLLFLGYINELALALKNAAEAETGIWWLVMDQPTREGNRLESSGSAMYVYSFLKAIRKGYLDSATYKPVAKKAYEYLVDNYVTENSDGTLTWTGTVLVGSLEGNGTFEYYIGVPNNDNDLKGLAPFVLASLEYEAAFPS